MIFKKQFIMICLKLMFMQLILQVHVSQAHDVQFESILTKQGLPQASVTSIAQDQTGFLWFGTYEGLSRYDGYSFKVFKADTKDPRSLQHNFVRTLLVDRAGRLWAGTSGGGLSLYDHQTETFVTFIHDETDTSSISFNHIYTIFEDQSGTIWIGTWGGGLNKIVMHYKNQDTGSKIIPDSVSFIHFRHDPVDKGSLASNKMTSIYQDGEGLLWIGTREGISVLDPESQLFLKKYCYDPGNPNSISSDNIASICGDSFGQIWIGTWGGGLNRFDPKTGRFERFYYDLDNPVSISHNTVMSLYTDKSGNLWIGTWGGGLNRILKSDLSAAGHRIKFHRFQQKKELEGGGGYSIYDMYQDKTGVLWVGTDWNGLRKLDPDKNQFRLYNYDIKTTNSLNSNTVFSIYKDQAGTLWIGTLSGGLNVYNEKTGRFDYFMNRPDDPYSLSSNTVRSIHEDHAGRLWIGTENGLNQFNRRTNQFKRYYRDPVNQYGDNILCIYESDNGILWLGTWENSLILFDPQKDLFQNRENFFDDNLTTIENQIIWSIKEDLYGRIWIGTDRSGLYRYDKRLRQVDHFMHDERDSNSLAGNLIYTLYVSENGDLWVATNHGLDQIVNPINIHQPLKINHYTTENGLYNSTVQSIIEDNHGNLWISNSDHLVCLNPETGDTRGYNADERLRIGEFIINAVFKDKQTGELYVGGKDGFTCFHPDSIRDNPYTPDVVLTSLRVFKHEVVPGQVINGRVILEKSITQTKSFRVSWKVNVISFEFAALHFNSPENNMYAYMLDGFDKDWNYSGRIREATYTNLDPGHYEFKVKASNSDGLWNETDTSVTLIVTPPFWETFSFRVILVIILILGLYLIYRISIHQIEINRAELEKQVKDRTHSLMHITKELKKSNNELEQFAYVASHDLQEPLRMISAYAGLLEKRMDTKLDQDSREFLSFMKDGAVRMQVLINDLLEYSRISTKGKPFKNTDFNDLMKNVLQNLKVSIDEKQAKITYNSLPGLNVDGVQMERVLQNLIGNAIKYCHLMPEVHIAAVQENGTWTFSVRDNGIGIEPKYQDKIFGIFQRLHGRDEYSGTGIGLAVCKKIIERHGGDLWVESEQDKGSVFYFTIPEMDL